MGSGDPMETFCFMLVEDFLMRKKMDATLGQFRSEWQRPVEENMTFSWYEICMKLRLHEALEAGSPKDTVMENLATMLTTESSLRMRAKKDVAVKGLATLPVTRPLPGTHSAMLELEEEKRKSLELQHANELEISKITHSDESDEHGGYMKNGQSSRLSRQQITNVGDLQKIKSGSDKNRKVMRPDQMYNPNKGRPSAENWVPEIARMKSLGRDLAVAEENLGDIIKRETQADREMRQFKTTVLQKALVEESLGSKKKIMCGCCMRMFSYVNLPLKVSNKAVVDLRKKWSNGKRGWWSARDDKLGHMPRCYNDVSVCHFCSQFFIDQDLYRPSLQKIEYEARRAAHVEKLKLEKERNDPVRMLEKDRKEWDEMLERQELNEVASDGGSVGGMSVQSGVSMS